MISEPKGLKFFSWCGLQHCFLGLLSVVVLLLSSRSFSELTTLFVSIKWQPCPFQLKPLCLIHLETPTNSTFTTVVRRSSGRTILYSLFRKIIGLDIGASDHMTRLQTVFVTNIQWPYPIFLWPRYFSSNILCIYSATEWCSEKKKRHLLEVAHSVMFASYVPNFFWGEAAILTACYLINHLPAPISYYLECFTWFFPSRSPFKLITD